MDYSRKDGKPGFTTRNKDGSTTFISLEDLEREGKKEQFLKDLEKNTGKTFQQWEDSWLKRRGEEQLKRDAEKLKAQSQAQQPQPQNPTPIKVEPFDPKSQDQTPPTTTPPTAPTPAKTYKVDGEDLTADDIKKKYDKLRYNDDGTLKPLKDLGDASGFGDRANRAVFPNQRVTRRMQQQTPSNAATGGVNPRAGSYAAYQNNVLKQLGSDYGRLPQNTIKPVAKRTMKQEAYDLVLDYLLSEGHVDTVEEAHYVMLQMTSEHVQQVVEERTAADPKMKVRMGHSNPAIKGKPVLYPKGHPEEGKPMSFNKAETDGVNIYRKASEKAGRKIYADEPLPKK